MTRWIVKLRAVTSVYALIEVEASDKETAEAEALEKAHKADWEPNEAPDAGDCDIVWADES